MNPPNGGLLSLAFGGSTGTVGVGQWDIAATGGLSASLLFGGVLIESGSRTQVTSNSITFGIQPVDDGLLNILATSVSSTWSAQYTFDQPGNIFSIDAGQTYTVSFDIDGQNGLLSNTLNIAPMFRFSFLDGNGNAIAEAGGGSLLSLVGLFGGSPTGTASFTFTPNASVAGAASILFEGSANLNTTALGLGNQFAEISNISISAVPVPEPSSALLIAAVGMAVLLRRGRRHLR